MTHRTIQAIASAYVETAKAEGCVDVIVRDVLDLQSVFKQQPTLLQNLTEGAVPLEQRRQALQAGFGKDAHTFTLNALLLLLDADLLQEFSSFVEIVEQLGAEQGGHREVMVTSAIQLSAEEIQSIEKVLRKKWNGSVHLTTQVETDILGGLILTTRNWSHDASLRGRIERLKRVMAS